MEIWKPVLGLEDRYEASNQGRIRGIKLYGRHTQPRIIASTLDERGYAKIYIINSFGKKTTTRAHILVCLAFHGEKPTELHQVNHKDGNKLNNTPDNLEWVTASENCRHLYDQLNGYERRPR